MTDYESIVPVEITSLGSMDPFGTQLVFVLDALDILTSATFGPADVNMIKSLYPTFDDSFLIYYGQGSAVESMLTTYPDVIIGRYGRDDSINTPVRDAGVPVVVDYVESPELLIESANMLGAMLGKEAEAQAFEDYYRKSIAKIKEQTDLIPEDERIVMYMTKSEPLNTVGQDQYQTEMAAIAGATSASIETLGGHVSINLEQLYLWDPDAIVLAPYCSASIEDILADEQWQDLRAVQDGAVYRLPKYLASWDLPIPESILGMIWLAETLYPDYIDIDIEEEIVAFYDKFYGLDIDEETIDYILTDTTRVRLASEGARANA
jgi:iron complex transport system substrate-binding protein